MGIKAQDVMTLIAPLKTNKKVTSTHFLMSFSDPLIAGVACPGQFLMVSLVGYRDPFLPRPFAIYDIDGDSVEVLYKKVGKGTTLLTRMRKEDSLRIVGPLGRGFVVQKDPGEILVVAGGTGIASVYFLMKQCLQQGSKVSLFYGARSKEEILSLPKLDSVGLNMYVATEDGSVGYHGKVSDLFASFLQTLGHPNAQGARAFVCGPTPMMVAIAELLERFGLPGQFSLETQMACGYGACQGCVVETAKMNEQNMPTYQRVCVEGPVFFLNEIPWDRLRVSKNILFRG